MPTLKRFDGASSWCNTPDPPALQDTNWARNSSAESDAQHVESLYGTLGPIGNMNIEALKIKLQNLEAEYAQKRETQHCPDPAQPWDAAFAAVPPFEPQFIRPDWDTVMKAKPVKPLMKEQVVSEDSVGQPLSRPPSRNYAKHKGGSQQKLFAGAGLEDAQHLQKAQNLTNQIMSLLAGAHPFPNKADDKKVVTPAFSAGTTGHLHSCAGACEYAGHRGDKSSKAFANSDACFRSRYSGREAPGSSSRAMYGAAAWDAQGQDVRDGTTGGSYSAVVQDMQGSIASCPLVNSFDERTTVMPILSNPAWSGAQAELAEPRMSPHAIPLQVSMGSLGHPYSCGPACKFANSARGCKDGRQCSHCHLCQWTRSGAKSYNKQPLTDWISL